MKKIIAGLAFILALQVTAIISANAQTSPRPKVACSKEERKEHSFAACLTFSGLTCATAMRLVEDDSLTTRFAQRTACSVLANKYSDLTPSRADRKLQGLATAAHVMEDGFDKLGGFWGFAGKLVTMGISSTSEHSLFNSCRERFEKKCYHNYLKWKGLDADEIKSEDSWQATVSE